MNKEQRQQYADKHLRRMNLFERQFVPVVKKALDSMEEQFTSDLKNHGERVAVNNLERNFINQELSPAMLKLHKEVGLYSAVKATREINGSVKKEQKAFGFNQQWINDIIRFFTDDFLSTVAGITRTTKNLFLEIIALGQKEGWGIDRIVSELESDDLTITRARLIVRTELVKAMAYGKELAIRDSEWLINETWVAARDHRTRHSHRIVDGNTIVEGGKFQVPIFKKIGKVDIQIGFDLMKRPGDKSASIGNLANCRCTSFVRAARNEQGRLIRKQQKQAA